MTQLLFSFDSDGNPAEYNEKEMPDAQAGIFVLEDETEDNEKID